MVTKQKPFVTSIYAKTFSHSQKLSSSATNTKLEINIPRRKLPLGAIPNYIRNFKGSVNPHNAKKDKKATIDKFYKNNTDKSLQDNATEINKISCKEETENTILHENNETSKNKLFSVDSVPNPFQNFSNGSEVMNNF